MIFTGNKLNWEGKSMDLTETICFCGDVSAQQIKDAVEAGATTVDDVGKVTGAGTHCGGCQGRIAELIDQFKK
jgi:NAD(P)H-nitrite reductase large subunit